VEIGNVRLASLDTEMRQSYLDYAMSVIVQRALPDARDGLKPVHRRVLYAMAEMGMRSNTRYRKSAGVVGEVLPEQSDHHGNGSWMYANGGMAHATTIVPINTQTPDRNRCGSNPNLSFGNWNISWGFKSRHSGGANFVFVDGSVRFMTQTIDATQYLLLGARNDGQPVQVP